MSTIGKTFAVLNLVLAALFLGWAANTLGANADWKSQFDDAKTELNNVRTELTAQVDDLSTQLTNEKATSSRLLDEKNDLELDKTRVQGDLTSTQEAEAQLRAALDGLKETQAAAEEARNALEQSKSQAMEAKAAAEMAREEAVRAQTTAEMGMNETQAALTAAQANIEDLMEQQRQLRMQLEDKQVTLDAIAAATGISLKDFEAVPDIDAEIVEANYSVEPGMVAINKGSTAGVQRGMEFDVYAGSDYKGRVQIFNVRENMSSAIILSTVGGARIGQLDKASTRL